MILAGTKWALHLARQTRSVHRDKWAENGEPMPTVIVLGGDPMTFLMGTSDVPHNVCEYDVVGGIRGEAMQLIEGKHTGLPFPADAEIVIEGFVSPTDRRPEGPFGEWTGYYGSKMRAEPVMEIKAIYHRNNPILLGCPAQRPLYEVARYRSIIRSAMLKKILREPACRTSQPPGSMKSVPPGC